MLEIYRSSDTSQLRDAFKKHKGHQKNTDPFAQDWVIVQNMDVATWLNLAMADVNSISANIRYQLPVQFLKRLIESVAPENQDELSLDKSLLTWLIFEAFRELSEEDEFEVIRDYISLKGDAKWRRWQLARQTADVMEQYILYRADWLQEWDNGKIPKALENDSDAVWQMALWRHIRSKYPQLPVLSDGIADLTSVLEEKHPIPEMEELVLFMPGAMPPAVLKVLCLIGKHIPIVWYQHQLTEQTHNLFEPYLQEDKAQAEILEKLAIETGTEIKIENLPTLKTEKHSSLHSFQKSIFKGEKEPFPQKSCSSIQVHSCHSKRREVEVLHDSLLDIFANSEITPGEVLVASTNPSAYEPFVRSVFDQKDKNGQQIPYSYYASSSTEYKQVTDGFQQMIALSQGRFKAPEIMAFLEIPAVRERFGLSSDDISKLIYWAKETEIRWGIHAAHKEALDLPPSDHNTWRFAIDRLILGSMMREGETLPFGILPYDDIDSASDKELLGKWLTFLENLFELNELGNQEKKPVEWAVILSAKLEALFSNQGGFARGFYEMQSLFFELEKYQESNLISEDVSLSVIASWITSHLDKSDSGRALSAGVVTFAPMVPLRNLPFKIVCLLGMNEGEIPARQTHPSFDLIQKYEQKGDRNRRNSDRLLFLQYLNMPADTLYISYIGQSQRSNEAIPPSILVSDAMNVLDELSGVSKSAYQCIEHGIQSFSERYFNKEHLFTYDSLSEVAAQTFREKSKLQTPFVEELAGFSEEQEMKLSLVSLQRFWKKPIEQMLKQEYNIKLDEDELLSKDNELEEPDGLQRYAIRSELLDACTAGKNLDQLCDKILARGSLPPGSKGSSILAGYREEIEAFIRVMDRDPSHKKKTEVLSAEITLSNDEKCLIEGEVEIINGHKILDIRPSSYKARDLLPIWIQFLLVQMTEHNNIDFEVWRIEKDSLKKITFKKRENPEKIIAELIEVYLAAQSRFLPLFPDSMKAFAEDYQKNKDSERALDKASNMFYAESRFGGFTSESEDMYTIYALGDNEISFDDDFAELCYKTTLPAQEHILEEKL